MSEEPRNPPLSNERRLAAIVFTDVVGYSARMQEDETRTMTQVRADFAVIRERCGQHGGEVLKSTGDGLLLCFASVVQAVACALQIQKEFGARPAGTLQHRIGIHLGDVFREGGDVTGDGVNIAARLETKARPGAVCLSQSVYDAVKGKLPMLVESLGPQQFKNIAEPIFVYLVAPAGAFVNAPAPSAKPRKIGFLAAAMVLVVGVLAFLFWPKSSPPIAGKSSTAPIVAAVPDKSIAVLPFVNMSEDKDNAFFADGVHEDLLTNLANLGELKVISRTSVIQYRGTTKAIRQIGTELGVAYVLEGSVRRAGNKVRVTGQLINTRTDEHVWAKAYDRDLTDVFAIQGELAVEIATALRAAITPQEQATLAARPTANLAAYELYMRARFKAQEGFGLRDQLDETQALLESAVQLDPQFADAWADLARVRLAQYGLGSGTSDQLARVREALNKAVLLAPDSFSVLRAQRQLYYFLEQSTERVKVSERIARLYPNRVETRIIMASEAWFATHWQEALDDVRQAVRLDPRGLDTLNYSVVYLLALRRYDEAEALQRVVAEVRPPKPQMRFNHAFARFVATGSTAEGDALLATISPEALRNDRQSVAFAAEWSYFIGDAATVVQLWQGSGTNWRFSNQGTRYDLLSVATCYFKLGQRDLAQPLLRKSRDLLQAQLTDQPDNPFILDDLALTLALLGEKDEADRALAKVRELIGATTNQTNQVNLLMDTACTLGWLGRKTEAIDLATATINRPALYFPSRMHALRRSVAWWPLQGDTRFEALVNDPKNNAPLF